MRSEFANRFGAFKTTLTTLNSAKFKPVWFQKQPLVFTTRVAEAAAVVDELEQLCVAQETNRTGASEQKAREAAEAEEIGFQMARALVEWFRDHGDEINAAKVDLSRSKWHALRDQSFMDQLRITLDLTKQVAASGAPNIDTYGINDDRIEALTKEVQGYADIIAMPQSGIAERKGLTQQMRDKFNAVEAKFASMDNLILQFSRSTEGLDLIAAYQAARIVRDIGGGTARNKKPAATTAPESTATPIPAAAPTP